MKKIYTRREVLTRIAALGGAAPLVKAMGILGIMNASGIANARITPHDTPDPGIGQGKKVAIIGAGLSGLTAAYELSRRGFECHIFEADNRAKGRTFTVRPDGSSDSWYQETGREPEVCSFDEVDGVGSLYFEAGAGRIPSHHRNVLNYCESFGVKLESYIFNSRQNLVRSDRFNCGKPVQMQRFKHNLRGYLAEMFRTADPAILDENMSKIDNQKLLDSLSASFGQLDAETFKYIAPSRAGYIPPGPGAGNQTGEFWKPFAFADLLNAKNIWNKQLYTDMTHNWQSSLMQPVGGIDNIAAAFMRQATPGGLRVGNLIRLSRKVVSVRVLASSGKVVVVHEHVNHLGKGLTGGGGAETFTADYCISTIAPSLLAKVSNNFDSQFKSALGRVKNVPAGKVAWQADRFWESDKYQIYGGISWTSDPISQIWYPSTGFHNKRGILTGAYLRGDSAKIFGDNCRTMRIKNALNEGTKLHSELKTSVNDVSKAMTIAWQNMPFQDGGWFSYSACAEGEQTYQTLLKGQKDIFFMAGDSMSNISGWMEGAIGAGLLATENIIKTVFKKVSS